MNDRLAAPPAGAAAVRARCKQLLPQLVSIKDETSAAADTLALSALDELIAIPSEHACPDLVESLLAIVAQRYYINDTATALPATSKAVSAARYLRDQNLLRKALTFHGVILKTLCQLTAAIEAYVEAIEVARAISDPVQEAPVWNNVGGVLMTNAQYADAMQCFERAAELAQGDTALVAVHAHCNVATCQWHQDNLARGIESARRSIELNESPRTTAELLTRCNAEGIMSLLLLRTGAIAEAGVHAAAAAQFNSLAPTPRGTQMAETARASIELASSDGNEGATRLTAVLDMCRRAMPDELQDVLNACVAGFEAAGQADVALTYLHELLALKRDSTGQQLLRQLQPVADIGSDQSGPSRLYDTTASKALELATAIDRSINDLVNAAVTAAEQAGHDRLHIFRVSRLAELFVTSLGWEADLKFIGLAARLVDIGMLVVPNGVLLKPRGLSGAERRIVYEHTQFGGDILTKARLAVLQPCVAVARYHHEKWDGSGPWELKGQGIPAAARLVALCDAFDALTHNRPWRKALSAQAALRIIASEAGTRFDPELAAAFVRFVRDEFWKHDDFDAFLAEDASQNAYVKARERIARLVRGTAP